MADAAGTVGGPPQRGVVSQFFKRLSDVSSKENILYNIFVFNIWPGYNPSETTE